MSDILSENFLMNVQKGSVSDCQKLISQGAKLNYADSDGNSAAHHAVMGTHIDVLRFLISEGIDLDIANTEGNTALHLACQKESRNFILPLLLAGSDPAKKNSNDEKPGEKSTTITSFIKQIHAENKAFNVLIPDQRRKLKHIFDEIARDIKHINLDRSKMFNMFVDEVSEEEAEKDAKDFIASCALLDKESVNLDEWMFAFAKLWVCDPGAFQKFVDDYDSAVDRKGPFSY